MEKIYNAVKQFNDERDWHKFHTPENLAKSIAIEAGELLECFQWNNTDFDINHVNEELADVFIYCVQMAQSLNVDLEKIAFEKMEKNALKYPVNKAFGKSDKYSEFK